MKSLKDEEVDKKIAIIIQLFTYIYERDVFFQQYEKSFIKRIINSTSLSMEYESKIISKLKVKNCFIL